MRTHVTFHHPAQVVTTTDGESEDDLGAGVLKADSAGWFGDILRRVPGAEVAKDICQEDWGAVFFVQRDAKEFWVGLSFLDDPDQWVAHLHHGSFAWLQRWKADGKKALDALTVEVDRALRASGASKLEWYWEKDHGFRNPAGLPDAA